MNVVQKSKILLPKDVDLTKWAVIACDQFTSQPEYWENLREFIGDSPSALNLVLPEIYLKGDISGKVEKINSCMNDYLDRGLFRELDGFILTERTVASGGKRLGLIVSVDLEQYNYHRVRTAIRATEDTITSRFPIRMQIREDAPIELPHVLMLVDNPEKDIIEPVYAERESLELLYDFELNMGGGRLRAWYVADTEGIVDRFNALLDPDTQMRKYGWDAGLMLAVGDGNHSVAAAKEHWNKIKQSLTDEEKIDHPARFALVEVMNIYDSALHFEPIHRVIIGEGFVEGLKDVLHGEGRITLVTGDGDVILPCPIHAGEAIRLIQEFIEAHEKEKGWIVDFVHGVSHVREVAKKTGGTGILMPEFKRDELISYVVNEGNLPKKAFSLGCAENKKYYLEAKRIKNERKGL